MDDDVEVVDWVVGTVVAGVVVVVAVSSLMTISGSPSSN